MQQHPQQQQQSNQYLKSHIEIARLGSPQKLHNATTNNTISTVALAAGSSSPRGGKMHGSPQDVAEDLQPTANAAAPTLPMHSPHSPLHPHAHTHQQNKLSARYINNNKLTTAANSGATTATTTASRSEASPIPPRSEEKLHTSSSPRIASKLLCSCEQEECSSGGSKKRHQSSSSEGDASRGFSSAIGGYTASETTPTTKRLVATRNAATSPHLDMRRLGNLSTVSAKVAPSLAREKSQPSADVGVGKTALEKSNSLGESKPQKQLRTTRSLSPRPPVRHQQAIIVSDENEVVSLKLTAPKSNPMAQQLDAPSPSFGSKTLNTADRPTPRRHRKKNKSSSCRSEQTSPNITELSDVKFAYNQLTNRSTGCLVYVPFDPWLKMADFEDFAASAPLRKPRDQKGVQNQRRSKLSGGGKVIEGDPWVKRADSQAAPTAVSKQERFRQVKSFSATKFEVSAATDIKRSLLRPKLKRCKSPLFTTDDGSIISGLPLQSAPSSPHYLKTPENPFSSAFSLAYPYSNVTGSNSPPRSASFSPARAKDSSTNPFADGGSPTLLPNSPPPSISVAAAMAGEQQLRMKRCFLDVCNPNLLQARHSFSSVSNQDREDELQLNIRRLSEQMRKTTHASSLSSAVKISLSDRNVSDGVDAHHPAGFNISGALQSASQTKGADFTDYLAQFRSSEAKKAAAAAGDTGSYTAVDALSSCAAHSSSNTSLTMQKTQAQADALLETTC